MKILLTGVSGFIGSRLLDAACAAWGDDNVLALGSRPAARGKPLVYGPDGVLDDTTAAVAADAEVLLHAGAYTPKTGAQANALDGCNGNISFTANLLGTGLPKLRQVLYLSTLDVYGPADVIAETTPAQPATLYGWSKLYCEQMVRQYATQRGIAAGVLRIGHVYGPGEEQYAKFLPNAMRNIVAGKDVELWGEGRELRSLIYIDDVVTAVLAAIGRDGLPPVINVVGGQPQSVRALLEQAIAVSGRPVGLVQRTFAGTPRDFVFDTTLLKTHLLPAETPLDAGLRAELAHMERLA